MDKTLNPLACDEPGCNYVARSVRKLHKHYCDRHLAGIVRPSRIAELRRIMKGEADKLNKGETLDQFASRIIADSAGQE